MSAGAPQPRLIAFGERAAKQHHRIGELQTMSTKDLQVDDVIARIESGESQAEIAAQYQVSPSTLSGWLNGDADRAERSARAREASAEAWLDRGLAVLADALDKRGSVDATAARAYAQECARRAAVRNPAYRDKAEVTHSGQIRTSGDMSTDELLAIAAQAKRPGPDSK